MAKFVFTVETKKDEQGNKKIKVSGEAEVLSESISDALKPVKEFFEELLNKVSKEVSKAAQGDQ